MEVRHPKEGNIVGCDFSGIVVELGEGVDGSITKIGERVAGAVQGCKKYQKSRLYLNLIYFSAVKPNGAFAEYVVVPAEYLFRLPDEWTFEQAAQLGVACFTAYQCLYKFQALPSPFNPATEPLDLLVWSGTSSVGHYTIHFAKLSGMRVITTASPKHFDRVRSLSADIVLDYKDTKAGQEIRAATHGTLRHAVDCICEGTAPFQVSNALSLESLTAELSPSFYLMKVGKLVSEQSTRSRMPSGDRFAGSSTTWYTIKSLLRTAIRIPPVL